MNEKLFPAILIVGLLVAPAAAEMKLEVIPLKNRTAREMIPVLKPLLGGQGTITGMQGQLIVRTTPQNLEEIKKVLRQIDKELRNLKIMVRQGLLRDADRTQADVTADVKIGNTGRLEARPQGEIESGLGAGVKRGDSQVRVRANRETSFEDRAGIQQVVTMEGRPAVIHVTQSIPFDEVRTFKSGDRLIQRESVQFRNVTTGLRVLPRIQGDRVVLEVTPISSTFEGGVIETQELTTVVTGKLGEWMELGGLSQASNRTDRGILRSNRSAENESRTIFLKVEHLP